MRALRAALRSLLAPPVPGDAGEEAARLRWLTRLRWIAIGAQLLAIPPALRYRLLEPEWLPLFVSVPAALAGVNLLTLAALHLGYEPRPRAVLLHLVLDTAALSALLLLSGGAWNPLLPLLFVHAGLGALLLEGRLGVLFFAWLIACLLVLQTLPRIPPGLRGVRVPREILVPAQLLVALVFFLLTTWLSRTQAALAVRGTRLRERKTRIDRLRAVGALAAGLSHELATPLNTAKLRVGRLRRRPGLGGDPDLDAAAAALGRCEEVLRRMAGAPLRPHGLDLEVVDVDRLLARLLEGLAAEGPPPHLHRQGRGPYRALLPPVAFSQAVLNLVDNARRAGGPEGAVEVTVEARDGHVDVRVLDRGPGWPELVREHLGEPFVTTRPQGVGLGLYFVHTLAEALGGSFHLEEREGGGAVARIRLPAAGPEEAGRTPSPAERGYPAASEVRT